MNRIYYACYAKSYFLPFSMLYFDKNVKIRDKNARVSGGQYTIEALKDMMRSCGLLYLAALGVQ